MENTESVTVTDTLRELQNQGYNQTFEPAAHHLRSTETGKLFDAAECTVVDVFRFEGESNPDDMAVIYAIRTKDGDLGVVLDAFGTYGKPALGPLMAQMHEGRDIGKRPVAVNIQHGTDGKRQPE